MLVVMMAGFLFLMGYIIGEAAYPGSGLFGLTVAFIIWLIMTLISYFSGDTIFLTMSRARKIKPSDHPVLYNVVEEMKIASGLPRVPDVYIIDDPAPNAFATGKGPETASVAVTTGLLQILDRDELQGVIAHEMAHVKNRDVLYMMMVGVMMGTIVLLADIGVRQLFWSGGRSRTSSRGGGGQAQLVIMIAAIVLMILAPIIAQLIYFAVSRKKEYLADACAAQFTRYPEGLASALLKISGKPYKLQSATRATASMYIVNPMQMTSQALSDVTSTHPPISERVKILRAMGGYAYDDYDNAFRKVTGRPVGVVPVSALSASESKPAVDKQTSDGGKSDAGGLERIRQVTDMMWHLNSFIFIACACGTTLKIPPVYAGKKLECPHCRTPHKVPLPSEQAIEK